MINRQIDNKNFFQIYSIINLIIAFSGLIILIFYAIGVRKLGLILVPIPLYLSLKIFELIVRPSYVEIDINEREIVIRTFNPESRISINFISLLLYRRYLKELRLNQHDYNDYKLLIDRFGLRKRLILQKIQKDGIYESSAINISMLGQKKYSNLILSIDRLKVKINLN